MRFGFYVVAHLGDPAVKICGNGGSFSEISLSANISQSGKQYGETIWRNNMAKQIWRIIRQIRNML